MRVLVVEDEPRMAALLARSLTEEGHAVDSAPDGYQGLTRLAAATYDCLVLDCMLPDLDGLSVCRILRDSGHSVPILMLTARNAVEDRIRGLDAGADDYLAKPFSPGELAARLRALVRRVAGNAGGVLEVGGLRLEVGTHQLWRDGVAIELTAREFALLELFMRHPGQVLTRATIIATAWDGAREQVGSNVVDQYVAYLRRKVDRPFAVSQLDTVRGVGYRLRSAPVPAAC